MEEISQFFGFNIPLKIKKFKEDAMYRDQLEFK